MPTLMPLVMGREAMIATEHYLSAAAGARIFTAGGNAIDAALAAAFVEGVVNPHMHTVGGEAPMLIYGAKAGRVMAINGNMIAPARATLEHFRSLNLEFIPPSGLLAAGVPAAFDAFVAALEKFGTMSLAQVVEPALQLCEDGFPMHPGLAGESAQGQGMNLGGQPATILANAARYRAEYPTTAAIYMPGGEVPARGAIIRNPALARCFRRLLDAEAAAKSQGREAALQAARSRFYHGDIAREIVAWSDAHGGLLAGADLARFSTRLEEPVSLKYRGATVFKCGPWSQGPVFLQQLRLLEGGDLRAMGHNSTDYVHLIVEAAKLAFADREAYYADPEFVAVPLKGLLSERYAAMRRALIGPRASLEQRPGDPVAMRALRDEPAEARPWGHGTTEVVAGDRAGNLITIIASGGWIPSSPVIESLGFPLGSRMQTFHLNPRHPNVLAPFKRPRTTLTPSMAARGGDIPTLAFGTPGGDQQDQWSLQFFLNLVEFEMGVQEAIEAPRFSTAHFPSTFYPHGTRPGVLRAEDRIAADVLSELSGRGHQIETRPAFSEGYVLAVELDRRAGLLRGGADPRGQLANVMPAHALGW